MLGSSIFWWNGYLICIPFVFFCCLVWWWDELGHSRWLKVGDYVFPFFCRMFLRFFSISTYCTLLTWGMTILLCYCLIDSYMKEGMRTSVEGILLVSISWVLFSFSIDEFYKHGVAIQIIAYRTCVFLFRNMCISFSSIVYRIVT